MSYHLFQPGVKHFGRFGPSRVDSPTPGRLQSTMCELGTLDALIAVGSVTGVQLVAASDPARLVRGLDGLADTVFCLFYFSSVFTYPAQT